MGGVGTLTSAKPLLTVGSFWPYATTLFDYLRRAMPYDSPGSLSPGDAYALTAHLLERSGVIPAAARLDATSLPAVRMPNRDGFESAWPARSPTQEWDGSPGRRGIRPALNSRALRACARAP